MILSEFLDFFFSFALKIWNNFKLHFFLLKEKILFYFIFESEVFPSPYLSAAVFSVLCEISVKGLFLVSFFSRVLGPAGLTEQGWGRGEDPVLALAWTSPVAWPGRPWKQKCTVSIRAGGQLWHLPLPEGKQGFRASGAVCKPHPRAQHHSQDFICGIRVNPAAGDPPAQAAASLLLLWCLNNSPADRPDVPHSTQWAEALPYPPFAIPYFTGDEKRLSKVGNHERLKKKLAEVEIKNKTIWRHLKRN